MVMLLLLLLLLVVVVVVDVLVAGVTISLLSLQFSSVVYVDLFFVAVVMSYRHRCR